MVRLVFETRSFVFALEAQVDEWNLAAGVHAVRQIPGSTTSVANPLENRLEPGLGHDRGLQTFTCAGRHPNGFPGFRVTGTHVERVNRPCNSIRVALRLLSYNALEQPLSGAIEDRVPGRDGSRGGLRFRRALTGSCGTIRMLLPA